MARMSGRVDARGPRVAAAGAGHMDAPPSGIANAVYRPSRRPRGGGLRPSRARGPFAQARATTSGP